MDGIVTHWCYHLQSSPKVVAIFKCLSLANFLAEQSTNLPIGRSGPFRDSTVKRLFLYQFLCDYLWTCKKGICHLLQIILQPRLQRKEEIHPHLHYHWDPSWESLLGCFGLLNSHRGMMQTANGPIKKELLDSKLLLESSPAVPPKPLCLCSRSYSVALRKMATGWTTCRRPNLAMFTFSI